VGPGALRQLRRGAERCYDDRTAPRKVLKYLLFGR
jgi:hypothetical protein